MKAKGKLSVDGGVRAPVVREKQASAKRITRAGARAVRCLHSGPTLAFEQAWLARGIGPVAGVDEAGRGPWAGPVVAAAVILDIARVPAGIDDSKALRAPERERLFDDIMSSSIVGVGIADVARIDRDNILQATLWAMTSAILALSDAPGAALIDGNIAPRLACATETIVEGDARALSIAAASIIAKVTRDRLMIALSRDHPVYGWERNMGYGVPEHRHAIAQHGLTPHHRRSFRPVALAASLIEASANALVLIQEDLVGIDDG